MIKIPFPFFLTEVILFFVSVNYLGWGDTLLLYFVPCLLGLFIISVWGKVALMSVQSSAARGQAPTSKILHAGAIFISGLCFLVPSFFLRVLGICLLLPGLRHILIWKFKTQMLQKMSQGAGSFQFNGFSFGGGQRGPFGNAGNPFGQPFDAPPEREVYSAGVLDIKPLEVTHETKKNEDGE